MHVASVTILKDKKNLRNHKFCSGNLRVLPFNFNSKFYITHLTHVKNYKIKDKNLIYTPINTNSKYSHDYLFLSPMCNHYTHI